MLTSQDFTFEQKSFFQTTSTGWGAGSIQFVVCLHSNWNFSCASVLKMEVENINSISASASKFREFSSF